MSYMRHGIFTLEHLVPLPTWMITSCSFFITHISPSESRALSLMILVICVINNVYKSDMFS